MNRSHPPPDAAHRPDWIAQQPADRPSSFFLDSAYVPMPEHRRAPAAGRAGVWLLVAGLVVGSVFVVLVDHVPMVGRLLGG